MLLFCSMLVADVVYGFRLIGLEQEKSERTCGQMCGMRPDVRLRNMHAISMFGL